MEIKYPGKSRIMKETREFWLEVAKKFNEGMAVEEIREKFPNKKTGKPYHPVHIYKMLREINKESTATQT